MLWFSRADFSISVITLPVLIASMGPSSMSCTPHPFRFSISPYSGRLWSNFVLTLAVCTLFASSLFAGEPKDVAFIADVDHTEQRYVVLEPVLEQKSKQATDILIALHGHGSDRWQFIRSDRDETRAARDFAARHQMIFVSPDYRAATSWMGPAAEADLQQIITELRQRFSPERVFLCGGSMGGTSALTFTALHPEMISGVTALNPTANHLEYNNFQDAIAASFGGTKLEIPAEYKNRSAEYWPERFTMPVALTTGGKDTVVPADSTIRLANVLKTLHCPVLLIHREAGEHSTNYEDSLQAFEFMFQAAGSTAPAASAP